MHGHRHHVACHYVDRNIISRFASNAGFAPTLERRSCSRGARTILLHPTYVALPKCTSSLDFGSPAAFYFAIVSPQRQDVLSQASRTSGVVAALCETLKRTILTHSQQGVFFIPVVAETSRWVGPHQFRCPLQAGHCGRPEMAEG